MNDTDKREHPSENTQHVRVNDRRRFDPDGNPRPDAEEPAPKSAESISEPETGAEPAAASASGGEPTRESGGESGGESDVVQRLQAELEAARRRVDELARAILAGEQDREAFKQRVTRERERMLEVEKGNVAQVLLETVDDLDLSLKAADDSPLAQGVRMIRQGLLSRLQSMGVERVPLENLPFDPNVAEAMDMEVTDDSAKDGVVVEEIRAAYRLGGRVIRDGRVKVAKYVPPAQA